jgi:transcriptional regulator with XRE-family HTH domain
MLGTRIRDTRVARGMNRSDFARLVGVTPTAAWNWEVNGTQPRPGMLTAIARVLGTSESYLETGIHPGITPARRTYPEIIAQAQSEIALLNGVVPARVKITVEILAA